MDLVELKNYLDEKYAQYATSNFIENDPILIPHQFTKKEDIEISGFIAATLAWGLRKTIIKNCNEILSIMDNSPHDFILNHTKNDYKYFKLIKHRTFNDIDTINFLKSLQYIYKNKGGLEKCFTINQKVNKIFYAIENFRNVFFKIHPSTCRTLKHVSSPANNSTSKRINMYLRWMIRKDTVDFGIWKCLKPSDLLLPLDVHTARVSRALNLLQRTQNDWKAVIEVSEYLAQINPEDPIKYDIAIFGIGVNKEID